jgi:NADPH-dependent 2,4-dienoyl-CoA reductase/sulfur reductase-like enzyme
LSEDIITPAAQPRKLLVVGGGPAGLEAARIAALCGHHVVLAEASAHLGGAINVAKRAPRLMNIGDATYWLECEVYRLGVEVRLNTFMDVDDVRAEQADHVILATGSLPRVDGVQIMNPGECVPGVSQPHVLSSVDLLTDPRRPLGTHALVLDDVGHYEAIAAAEYLIEHGIAVTYVTRLPAFAPTVSTFNRASAALSRLYRGDFTLLIRHHLVEVRPGECVVRPLQSTKTQAVRADTVVLVTANEPLRDLYDALRDDPVGLSLVGDAASPRDLQVAIAEGHRAGRFFDSFPIPGEETS